MPRAGTLDLVAPAFSWAPPRDDTWGPEVADLCEQAGFVPDPEQRMALDVLFAERGGVAAAFEFAVVCSRQNLKTGLFKMAALGWLFITDQRLIVWSAHEFSTAQEAFRDMDELIAGSPFLARRVKQVHRGNGDEAIELVTGQRLKFKARTKGGGRGLTGDKVVLDEAYALRPFHMGALLPTLSARPDPQVVYGSSAGQADSDVLRGVRDRGRAGDASRLAYIEWCDPNAHGCERPDCDHIVGREGCALDDEARWAMANPALGRRISIEYIRAEREALEAVPEEFARERLGWWDEPGGAPVIDLEAWGRSLNELSQIVGRNVFGLDMPADRSVVDIGTAGLNEVGKTHLELVIEQRGTEWVIPWFTSSPERLATEVAIDGSSPAASLIPDLEAAGVTVIVLNGKDVAQACGAVYDAIHEGRVAQIGQFQLDESVAGVKKIPVGDGFRWGRKTSAVNISRLYAVTLAARGLTIEPGPLTDVGVWVF